MRRTFLVLPLALLASCIPFPHTRQYLPKVTGTVVSGGVPVEGARVQVADVRNANPCVRGEQTAQTDRAGTFATTGQRRWALFVPLGPIHGHDTWAVALIGKDGSSAYLRPWNYRAGPSYSPREVKLACDLEKRECAVHGSRRHQGDALKLIPCERFAPDAYSETTR